MKKVLILFLLFISDYVYAQNTRYEITSFLEKREPSLRFQVGIDTVHLSVLTLVLRDTTTEKSFSKDILEMEISAPIHHKRFPISLGVNYDTFAPEIYKIAKQGGCIVVLFVDENATHYQSTYVLLKDMFVFENIQKNEKVPPD